MTDSGANHIESDDDREDEITEIKEKLDEFLKELGYHSPEELDKKVQSVLKGDALSEYLAYKEQFVYFFFVCYSFIYVHRHNKQSETESTVFMITSIVSVSSGVFLGGLVVLGFMTGGVAFGLLGVVGAFTAVIALIMVLFAVFEGAKERAVSSVVLFEIVH